MPNKTGERRALVARLMAEGHATARSVAVALKDEHGVDAHRSTVARDMEVLRSGTKDAGPPEGKRDAIVARYEERIRSLTAMLRDEGLSKREKLAVHRTLNETESRLAAAKERIREEADANPHDTEEARRERNAFRLERLKEMAEEHQRKTEARLRSEVYAELREKGVEIPV